MASGPVGREMTASAALTGAILSMTSFVVLRLIGLAMSGLHHARGIRLLGFRDSGAEALALRPLKFQ